MKNINIKLKKSLGQNFLKNTELSEKIVNYLSSVSDIVLEIGPGNGALTDHIVTKQYQKIDIVEFDPYWAALLKTRYKEQKHVTVFEKNILDHEFDQHCSYALIGNIPYNITFPILMKIIDHCYVINEAVIMMQEEVAQKLIKSSGADYGPISILMQIFFDLTLCDFVPSSEFIPAPKVNSRVVYFKKKISPSLCFDDIRSFKQFISYFFVFPRKKIKSQNIPERILSSLSQEVKELRAQQLSPELFIFLYKSYKNILT